MNVVPPKETARLAESFNSKHRDAQRLGRTAKEITAEIGEKLIGKRVSKPKGGLLGRILFADHIKPQHTYHRLPRR
ncbi:hypothetical protein PH5382_02242 [Phaeobacter sp. CECT 5382]|nr:hypothetical protein PH5382_02242 [Phaeobacter sp. CECT 5382]